jgi:hypothetical protein
MASVGRTLPATVRCSSVEVVNSAPASVSGRLIVCSAGTATGAGAGACAYRDNFGSFSQVVPVTNITVMAMASSDRATYYLFANGVVVRALHASPAAISFVNNGAFFLNGLQADITILQSGAAADGSDDRVAAGTSANAGIASNRFGVFVSLNGGSTWTQRSGGSMAGLSVFSISSPGDGLHLVAGTINGGLHHSSDGGVTWTASAGAGGSAWAAAGFCEHPTDPDSFLIASATLWHYGPVLWLTQDAGTSWTRAPFQGSAGGIATWSILLDGDGTITTVPLGPGEPAPFLSSASSIAGPWTTLDSKAMYTSGSMFRTASGQVFAFASLPFDCSVGCGSWGATAAAGADLGLYRRGNSSGDAWSQVLSATFVIAMAELRAVSPGSLVAISVNAAYFSSDSFGSTPLSRALPAGVADALSIASVDDQNGNEQLLLASQARGVFVTTNMAFPPPAVLAWQAVPLPALGGAPVIRVTTLLSHPSIWFFVALSPDKDATLATKSGAYATSDFGASWTTLTSDLFPSNLIWTLYPSTHYPSRLYAGMYGGGFLTLDLSISTNTTGSSTGQVSTTGGVTSGLTTTGGTTGTTTTSGTPAESCSIVLTATPCLLATAGAFVL